MRPPQPLPALDLLIMESTYGNRRHAESDPWEQLADVVNTTVKKGGVLLIPSFAVGRAQTLQFMLSTLMDRDRIPRLSVFLDSPMAIDASDIYCRYADQHRLSTTECQHMCRNVTYTQDVGESKALADINYPHIIIAGSGMATGGRILHHMKRLLPDHRTTLLFTGYQAGGTRGARMLAGVDTVKIHGMHIRCNGRVEVLDGLSGHADYKDLANWLHESEMVPRTPVKLVHGEPDAADFLRLHLQENSPYDVEVAQYRQIHRL